MFTPGIWQMLIVLVIILLFFGGKRIPTMMPVSYTHLTLPTILRV